MAFPLFSQTIITPKSNLSSLVLIPNKHNRKQNTIIKAEAGNGDQLQRTNLKTQQQQKQPIKKRLTQAPPIGLWDRFPTARTVQQMMDTMERLMDDPLSYNNAINNIGTWGPQGEGTSSYSRGRTPWEIKEGEHDYKVRFDMPGMTKQDVKVWVEEKMLVLKAEKIDKNNINGESNNGEAAAIDDEGDQWSAKSYGKYSFRIALPENIQFEKIKAEVRDGVLYVTIPKAPVSSKVLDINVQ
uniref:small heat shock protein, chloroplastic-like n=1 Tax=Erigeron canadensis TaxID=72917 RepID=UPI001CB94F38|nr:small heat shock protein, chloroplastic-like [Erigeron canadensis]